MMQSNFLTNKTKMFIFLLCMMAYSLIYVEFIKVPLLKWVTDLPPAFHSLLLLLTASPVWALGACSVYYYLQSQKEDNK